LDGQILIIAFLHKQRHVTKSKTDAICFQEKKMLTLERRKALRSEKLEGDPRGGGGRGLLESWNNLGRLFFFGVVELGNEEVGECGGGSALEAGA
jgi:hypothetical protein